MSIQVFEYPGLAEENFPGWEIWNGIDPDNSGSDSEDLPEAEIDNSCDPQQLTSEFEQKLAEETRRSFEAGREQGRQEGRSVEREAHAATAAADQKKYAQQLAELVDKFSHERESYLHTVESEVVKLALAVAARILRREAQMDPLLLLGAVRVALGQLSASTLVRLRIPPKELELWTEAIELLPKTGTKLEIVVGENMRLGDCVIETEMGSVDLGVRAQLNEIERGFFDRAGAAPDNVEEHAEHQA